MANASSFQEHPEKDNGWVSKRENDATTKNNDENTGDATIKLMELQ